MSNFQEQIFFREKVSPALLREKSVQIQFNIESTATQEVRIEVSTTATP
jgi:ribosomal protein L31